MVIIQISGWMLPAGPRSLTTSQEHTYNYLLPLANYLYVLQLYTTNFYFLLLATTSVDRDFKKVKSFYTISHYFAQFILT